jgi:hypothetical protein
MKTEFHATKSKTAMNFITDNNFVLKEVFGVSKQMRRYSNSNALIPQYGVDVRQKGPLKGTEGQCTASDMETAFRGI